MKVSAIMCATLSLMMHSASYGLKCFHHDTQRENEADNHSQALWLMLARRCDEPKITEYAELTEEHFLMTDEKGKNIYEIALQIHKDTNSIPCAIMAGTLHRHAVRIRKKLDEEALVLSEEKTALRKKQCELNERISKLETEMSKFEVSHK